MHKRIFWSFLSLLLGAAASAGAVAAQPGPAQFDAVREAAAQSQEQCFTEIYRDTNAYAQCIRNLARAHASQPTEQLGVFYFGFVGALSYMRVSQAGVAPLAAEFLKNFRKLQAATGLSDAQLCASVPGNCDIRIGQTLAMERAPAPAPARSLRPVCQAGVCRMEGQ
jgi:hypothetical protein